MHQDSSEQTARYYYLENFRVLADFVSAHYNSLLSPEERHFYHTLISLPEPAQLLCTRLLMRRGEYIRHSKINYPEVEPLSAAIEHLQAADFIKNASTDYLPDWIGVFSSDELHRIFPAGYSTECASLLAPDLLGDTPVELLQQLDTVYQVNCKAHYQIYLLLFFGNLHQDLSEFVLRDLGLRDYEPYLTDTAALPFHSREQLLAYWQYYQCVSVYDDACDKGPPALHTLFEALPQDTFNDGILKRRIHTLYNKIARQLEREAELESAASIYRASSYPPARERLARVEAARGNDNTALDLCNTIINNPANSEELEFAEHFSARVSKRIGIASATPGTYRPPVIELELAPSTLTVEQATALHFARSGHCYYVENSLLNSVFGLAFWDIIFAPVSGMFYNPFQRAPLDFYDKDFSSRRQQLIDERIHSIKNGQLREIVFTHIHQKHGLINPMVQWSHVCPLLLATAMHRIPTAHWLVLFDYLLRDLKNHRSGLPDLIYFPNDGDYRLLEVKGPGDVLQKHQRRWMKHFHQNDIPHALVNVHYQSAQTSVPVQPLLAGQCA